MPLIEMMVKSKAETEYRHGYYMCGGCNTKVPDEAMVPNNKVNRGPYRYCPYCAHHFNRKVQQFMEVDRVGS